MSERNVRARAGGSLQDAQDVQARHNGQLKSAQSIHVRDKGELVQVWPREGGGDIPDSVVDQLAHAYYVDDFSSGNWPDDVGSADIATINGLATDSNAFSGSGAVVGDGSGDYGQDGTMGTFGSQLDTQWAVAFALSTTDSGETSFISNQTETDETKVAIESSPFYQTSSDTLTVAMTDNDGNSIAAESSYGIDDGADRVIIINKVGNASSDIEIYDAPTNNIAVADADQGFGNVSDFSTSMTYFARPDGTLSTAASLGNVFWFNESLDSSQRTYVYDQMFSWYEY